MEGKRCFFAITENRSFIFRDDGIIIIRSASYLWIREWVGDFNDSFSNLLFLSIRGVVMMMKCHNSDLAFDHQQVNLTLPVSLCFLCERFSRTCAVQELPYLPLFLYALSFHPILHTPSPFSSHFSFYPFVFAADEKIAAGIGWACVILATCQSSDLSLGSQTAAALVD